MHDWVLKFIELDWHSGSASITVIDSKSINREIKICEIISFDLSRNFEWGESVNINATVLETINEESKLTIELQSGDVIKVIAKIITLPASG